MSDPAVPEKTKPKRASQSKRKHIRRMKQEANKAGMPEAGNNKKRTRPS